MSAHDPDSPQARLPGRSTTAPSKKGARPREQRLVLIGFSTTGKTRVGQILAQRLGWRYIDTDEAIVAKVGKGIPEIFAQDGEKLFRELESQALEEALQGEGAVVATGGGAVLPPENRELMRERAVVVCLEAKPETILERLRAEDAATNPVVRPLLQGADPLARINYLKGVRQALYAIADWAVHTDYLSPEEVAEEVLRGRDYALRAPRTTPPEADVKGDQPSLREEAAPYCADKEAACIVETPGGSYPVFVGWGILDTLGGRMRNAGLAGSAALVADPLVLGLHGAVAERSLREAGFRVKVLAIAGGEACKSLESAAQLYDQLIEGRFERRDAIVALGGGVTGDLAGFVAATYLRGVPFVQAPTTLLAIVDASIGGKVAVNHPRGKNLIGAFYQPRLVLADTSTLATLPARELACGWAEVIKHGFSLDAGLFTLLESRSEALARLEPELVSEVITRNVRIKAAVVKDDERDQEERAVLNFGHTIGHGIEAASGYARYLHGEAVAIGMCGAAITSQHLGLIDAAMVSRLEALLGTFGLPTRYQGIEPEAILQAISLDKKTAGRRVRWVLSAGLGRTSLTAEVAEALVAQVVKELRA